MGAALAGGGGAAGAQGPVRRLAGGPEAVRLHARGVRAAVGGGGVAGQPLVVVGHAARAAARGAAPLVQGVHVQLQGVAGADVGLAVLLLLWRGRTGAHVGDRVHTRR